MPLTTHKRKHTHPHTHAYTQVVMLMGGGVYAYVVGGICSTLANMNPELTDFHSAVDQLNAMCTETRVSEVSPC